MHSTPLTPDAFVARWKNSELKERSAAQPHFMDLCSVLGVPSPTEADARGAEYTFERKVKKDDGRVGFADVWRRGCFAWEYKGRGRDLDAAYRQLLAYREDLENPRLLVACDFQRIVVHTNFTAAPKRVETFQLEDLLDPTRRARLRQAWLHPDDFNPATVTALVTEATVADLMRVADSLHARGHDREAVAQFLVKVVFTMFAEDAGIVLGAPFTGLCNTALEHDLGSFRPMAEDFFAAMDRGRFDFRGSVPRFNGAIFRGGLTPELTRHELQFLMSAARHDWTGMDPTVFGTLFERILDPGKRTQIGAHYTSATDILAVLEPVVVEPLRREWASVRTEVEPAVGKLIRDGDGADSVESRAHLSSPLWLGQVEAARAKLEAFRERLAAVRVLDPACGSGNFLYLALHRLLDLENEVRAGLGILDPQARTRPSVHPRQLLGLEVNPTAHRIATTVVWIGYLQWLRSHDEGREILERDPILDELPGIENRDALLDGNARSPWPAADFVVGNPPFLGGKMLRSNLGSDYVDRLFAAYEGHVPREADLVCYWFDRARRQVDAGHAARAGFIATNSIRGGANRRVLEPLRGRIFLAESDRPWVLDGAAVRVSIVAFDGGTEVHRVLNGREVAVIAPDLTAGLDLTRAGRLVENAGIAFMGDTKGGAFDVPGELARSWLDLPNPNGRSNREVLRPWVNGLDVTRGSRGMWIVDFGLMPEAEAAMFEQPYQHVLEKVKPGRATNSRAAYRDRWWQHVEPRPAMQRALAGLRRFIVTPTVAKHRLFAWVEQGVLPDHQLIAFARDDDFTFGVLHSRVHELWSLRMCSFLGVGNDPRYTPSSTFETYPFPDASPDQREAVARAARDLDAARGHALSQGGSLTALYNRRPAWLGLLHESLDRATHGAYGWEFPLPDDEILTRLLALNEERGQRPRLSRVARPETSA